MSASVLAFQTQLASVMDVLVRNTVCEITRLYEDSLVNFQSIIAQHEEENASLKIKLQQSEKALVLQSHRESRKIGAESQENLVHSDTLIKQEEPEGDVKIDTFCAVCGKAAESEPPFCDACRKTVSFQPQSPEGSPGVEGSHQEESAGKSVDFSEESELNMFDTEAFPGLFDKGDSCFSAKDVGGGSAFTPISPMVPMVISSYPEVPVMPSVSQSGPSRTGRRSAKRPRPSPEVEDMAAEAREVAAQSVVLFENKMVSITVNTEEQAKAQMMPLTRKEKSARYWAKLNPVKKEEILAKRRARYQARKASGTKDHPAINDLSQNAKEKRRSIWRKAQEKQREKKKRLKEVLDLKHGP